MSLIRIAGLVSLLIAAACGAPETDEVSYDEQEVRLSPCATVRCAAGTHCVAKGRRAYCVADKQACTSDADCRLFDNYCGGCACDALLVNSPDPFCSTPPVQCFRQPCGGMTAVCSAGVCTASSGSTF
jgi:hypothetical protein